MASDDLSQTLFALAAWMSCIAAGTHAMTPEGADAFGRALDRAAKLALAAEYGLASLVSPRDRAAIREGIRAGTVRMLATPLAVWTICGDLDVVETMPLRDGRPA